MHRTEIPPESRHGLVMRNCAAEVRMCENIQLMPTVESRIYCGGSAIKEVLG